jgi:O-methyltransferase domain/Dimerisation domain
MNDTRLRVPLPAEAAMLRQLIMGFRSTQVIYVAARLGLADRLESGAQTAQQLAPQVGAAPRALHRLLRALAGLGIFAEAEGGTFALTPAARLLQTDAPGSLRGLALLYGADWLWRSYGDLLHSVRTGAPAFAHVHGQSFYEYLQEHPAAGAVFQAAMSGSSAEEAAAILAAYDFAPAATVIDVGGGQGALVAALLQAHPHLAGVVLDLSPAIAGAKALLAAAGLTARATCVAGDFFTAVPKGGDLYLLKSVLHNWDDSDVVSILRNCRQAMADGARLLVIERIIPDGNGPSEAKLFDINMLVTVGGQERTEGEYRTLLDLAGLTVTRAIPTTSPLSLLEAVPATAEGRVDAAR